MSETWEELFKRRKVPRRAIHKRVGLLISGHYEISVAKEIGEGGMLITSNTALVDGQGIVITFRIPNVVNGVMTATVVYSLPKEPGKPGQYGVKFDNLDFEVKRKIRNFVASATSYAADVESA